LPAAWQLSLDVPADVSVLSDKAAVLGESIKEDPCSK